MLRISKYVWVLFVIAALGVSAQQQQQQQETVGPHIEWFGVDTPSTLVDPTGRTITVTLSKDKEVVTVYSPPADKDFTYIVKTPNGQIICPRPHPYGFQATFAYHLLGEEQVLRCRIERGMARFMSVRGETGDLKAGETINIVIPRSGRIVLRGEQQVATQTGTTEIAIEEGFSRFPTVRPKYVLPRELEAMQGVREAAPVPPQRPVQQEKVAAPLERPLTPPKTDSVTGQVIVSPLQPVDIPRPQESTERVQLTQVRLDSQATATEAEMAKYYGEVRTQTTTEKKRREFFPPLELDHSEDTKVHIDGWLGLKQIHQEGTIRFDGNGVRGTSLTFDNYLGMDRVDNSVIGGLDLYFIGAHIGFQMNASEFLGRNHATPAAFNIGGITMPAGTMMDSKFMNLI